MTDVSRVYQFLAKFNENGNSWQDAVDSNGDGTIIKSEFRSFMEDNFEWDGETTEAGKNDLINSFWKTIDSNRSATKIENTKFKNANALDKNEVANMEKRIEMYEILNDFTSTLNAPTVISSTSEWKKSVSEGLAALVETYIKEGKPAEELQAYLEEAAPKVMNKATADYCATEYLDATMADLVDEYGYAYASDNTLQNIIDTYIGTLAGEEDGEEIKATVTGIIDAYMATAGLADESPIDLSEYGYTVTENSALNDLQKCIAQKKLQDNLEAIKNESNYENYAELYDAAVNEYISKTLANAKFSELEAIQEYGIEEFKATKEYQDIETTIEVKNVLQGDELYQALSSGVSESLADKIKNDGRYFDAYDKITEEAIKKAKAGDFDTDGAFDSAKLVEWAANEIKNNISEFYPNGLGDMPLKDLNIMYDQLAESAINETDDDKSLSLARKAAIQYCDAVCDKGALMKQAIKDIFGENYTTEINKLYPSEIEDKINELKERVLEIGDISTFRIDNWGEIPADITIAQNAAKNYQLNTSVKNGDTTISSDRISYKVSASGNATVSVNNNTLTVTGASNNGYTTITISLLVDGVELGEQVIKVKTVNQSFNWGNMADTYNGVIARDGAKRGSNGNISLQEAYSNTACLILNGTNGEFTRDWNNTINSSKTRLADFINGTLCNAVRNTGNYDENALKIAAQKTIELYQAALTQIQNGDMAGKKSDKTSTISYDGENYTFQTKKWYRESSAENTEQARSQSAANNQLGLSLNESYNSPSTYQVVVNMRCVMDIFNKFYAQAL